MDTHNSLPACTLAEAAALLQCSQSKLRRLLKAQRIPSVRLGSSWRIPRSAVIALREGREWSPSK